MTRFVVPTLLALALVPGTLRAQPYDHHGHPMGPVLGYDPETLGIYRALDGVLSRVRASYGADAIATDFSAGRRVTVADGSTGMYVDAVAEIVEALPGDKYRVRSAGGERVLTGRELKRLNLPYLIPDGATVLPGGSRWSGVSVTIDRVNDPHLRAFLEKASAVGRQPISDAAKIARLMDLVNTTLKYPGHETPDVRSSALEASHNGRAVPFGEYLAAGEGVCRHKAIAMKLALEQVGIASRYVAGEALARETFAVRGGHAWVEALTADGKRLLIDPTWGDPGVLLEEAYRKGKLRRPKPDARRIIPPGRRLDAVTAVDGPDLFSSFRRADGTVHWARVPREVMVRHAAGTAHFAFALFLKELPPVLASRDPARLEELASTLGSVGFFAEYGLFVVGAAGGEYAFERLALGRAAKSKFVHGLMKTQVALAAGLLVPQLVRSGLGLDGRAYVIDVAALGLSITAVKGAAEALSATLRLKRLRAVSSLARSSVAGWIYSAAELAVILTIGEELGQRAHTALAERDARERVRDVVDALTRLPRDASDAQVWAASDAVAEAYDAWRARLYEPVDALNHRLLASASRGGATRVVADDAARSRARELLSMAPGLRRHVEAGYGSVDAYLEGREAAARAGLEALLDEHGAARAEALRAVYVAGRRGTEYLDDTMETRWVLAGSVAGALGDPGRGLVPALTRMNARRRVLDRVASVSENRLEAYDDERTLWRLIALARPEWAEVARARVGEVDAMLDLERTAVLPLIEARAGAAAGRTGHTPPAARTSITEELGRVR